MSSVCLLYLAGMAYSQTTFRVDVSPEESCAFSWLCETRIIAPGTLKATASISGNVGLVSFADSKTVAGVVDITARVEPNTPDGREHLFECKDEQVFYTYSHDARIGTAGYGLSGHQPTPPNSIPCSCELVECEDCFEGEQPLGEVCDFFPDLCKRGGDNDPVNLIDFCPPECTSPLVVDLGGDGFAFGGPESAVEFDLLRSGTPLRLQWVTPGGNDAFLVQDLNGNGIVDDGAELFGNGTRLPSLGLAPNGFVALAQFDDPALGGDGDGYVSAGDQIWKRLLLWLDDNADGLCDPGEMIAVPRTVITGLDTIPQEQRHYDQHGNSLRYRAQVHLGIAPLVRSISMVDVYFKQAD